MNFLEKVKYRWNAAPLKIKVLDISCWVALAVGLWWVL